MIRALAGRGASSLAGQASAVQEYGHSALRRAWGCRQSWRTFSTSEEGASGSADIDQAQRPSPPTKDEKNLLNELYYKMKMGHGLPPIEEVLTWDTAAEKREERRQDELRKQEEIARSRVQVLDEFGRAYGTGKRKEAIAQVWLSPGTGDIVVNQKIFSAYFPSLDWRQQVIMPFVTTGTMGQFNVNCSVQGGGPSGQAQAVRHGISKALQSYDPELRPPLRAAGLLTRDSRVVERKKPGRKKARKSFQWVKR